MGSRQKTIIQPVTYAFPGTGADCGLEGWRYRACPSLQHWHRYENSCHRRDCPRHYRDWLKSEAHAVAKRVSALGRRVIRQHVIVSLKPDAEPPNTLADRKAELEKLRWILKFCGFVGGAVVLHGKRAHSRKEYAEQGDGAHYHIIAVGKCDPERVLGLYEQFGVVVKALGRDYKSSYGRAAYMLSHCSQPQLLNPVSIDESSRSRSLHCVTYWGCLSYNKLKVCEEEGEGIYCEGCKKAFPLREWHNLRVLDRPPDKAFGDMDWSVFTIEEIVRW